MRPSEMDLTTLLHLAEDPTNHAARAELYNRVEVELRRIAHARRVDWPAVRGVETTDLVHEVWLKLARTTTHWHNRRHFFATVSLVIQNLLFDYFKKLPAGPQRLDSDLLRKLPARDWDGPRAAEQRERYLALFDAIDRLQQHNPNAAEVFRMRCFASLDPILEASEAAERQRHPSDHWLTLQQVADYLDLPLTTVFSRWKRALHFLETELRGFAPEDDSDEPDP